MNHPGEDAPAELNKGRLATQLVSDAAAATVPMFITGSAAVAAAAGGAILASYLSAVWPARRERVDRTLGQADLDAEATAALSPDRAEVLLAAVECAATTRTDEHIRALVRVLRQNAEDEAGTRVDEHLLTIDTLSHLHAGHIRVLREVAAPLTDGAGKQLGVDRTMMADRQQGLGPALDRLIEDCTSLGLIYDTTHGTWRMHGWQNRAFQLTDWGRTCLDYLGALDDTTS